MVSEYEIYGLGGQLGCVTSLLEHSEGHQKLFERLQQTLSAVAVRPLGLLQQPRGDTKFIAELALGLLTRGRPTLSSPWIENAIVEGLALQDGFNKVTFTDPTLDFGLQPPAGDASWAERLVAALIPVDARLQPAPDLPLTPDERRLFEQFLRPHLGNAWGWIEPQRPIETMAPKNDPGGGPGPLQRVDFALETPCDTRVVVELDGPQHDYEPQKTLDNKRDTLLQRHNWKVCRIKTKELPAALNGEGPVLPAVVDSDPLLKRIREFKESDRDSTLGETATLLALAPHAIARVQLGILLGMLHGHLDLTDETWRIAVIERETPCALLAVHDMVELLSHLCEIYDIPFRASVILTVFPYHDTNQPALPTVSSSSEVKLRLHHVIGTPDQITLAPAHLVIDVAVRAWWTQVYENDPYAAVLAAATSGYIIRNAHRLRGAVRPTWSAPRSVPHPRDKIGHLEYFLKLLFRKPSFREGQIDIIERALRRQSVIGLLPTGAGKSLTFQLPALLSPGFTIVVAPIKSLMQDQLDNLALSGIDRAITINSDQSPEERDQATQEMAQCTHRLVYVSPERFQIKTFRDSLEAVCQLAPVSYVAIDEAHCVSEWGHDFRTAYLNLGRNARQLCRFNGQEPPLLALTATASRTVLIDVQRELGITDPDAIISSIGFDRPELRFDILKVPKASKSIKLMQYLAALPDKLQIPAGDLFSGRHGGIVFCPHVNGALGVLTVRNIAEVALLNIIKSSPIPVQSLTSLQTSHVHVYAGQKPAKFLNNDKEWTDYKQRVQRLFKSDRIPLIVATSSFGMGIDKPNIRYTIHYAMTQTVEEFVQQAGRAGRDRNNAICLIIFSDNQHAPRVDPLAEGISNEEARKRLKNPGVGNADDAASALFLFQQGFAGSTTEIEDIRTFYRNWILAKWEKSNIGIGERLEIIVDKGAVHAVLRHLRNKPLSKTNDTSTDASTTSVDKIIYRLSLLGIVEDYTIDYNAGTYTVTTRRAEEREIYQHLYAYIRRYRREDVVATVRERLEGDAGGDPVERAIAALCAFVYDEIEKTRRMAIRNMREILRKCKNGEELRAELNNYLSFNIFTREVSELLGSSDDADWWKIADKVVSSNDALQLLGQVRRIRESDAEHPGLCVLQGLALAAMPEPDPREAATLLILGLSNYARSPLHGGGDGERVAREIMSRLTLLAPRSWIEVARSIVARYQQTGDLQERMVLESLVRAVYSPIAKSKSDPKLERAAAVPILQSIAEESRRLATKLLETDA